MCLLSLPHIQELFAATEVSNAMESPTMRVQLENIHHQLQYTVSEKPQSLEEDWKFLLVRHPKLQISGL